MVWVTTCGSELVFVLVISDHPTWDCHSSVRLPTQAHKGTGGAAAAAAAVTAVAIAVVLHGNRFFCSGASSIGGINTRTITMATAVIFAIASCTSLHHRIEAFLHYRLHLCFFVL